MRREYAVYLLIDPRDTVVRYVGCSSDVIGRVGGHLSTAYRSRRTASEATPMDAWLLQVRDAGAMPTVQVVFRSRYRSLALDVEHAFHHHHGDTILNRMLATATVYAVSDSPMLNALISYAVANLRGTAEHVRRQARRTRPGRERESLDREFRRLRMYHDEFVGSLEHLNRNEVIEVPEIFDRATRMHLKRQSATKV
jgi:hypothetical protein